LNGILSAVNRLRQGGARIDLLDSGDGKSMKELLRSNDPVLLSFVSSLLEEAGIGFIVLDTNMSVLEGSIGILPRRVLIEDDSVGEARRLLTEAGVGHAITGDETT
jgi:hypothetical protein